MRRMKLLRRNTKEFEYLPNDGSETDLDSQGRHTGNFRPVYGDPVIMRGNISTPIGQTSLEFFGKDIRYTHVLVMDDPEAPIEETGRIRWKGDEYDIKAVRPSLNAMSVALQKRTKNHAEDGEKP